jgi:hypothetical protein
MKNIKRRRRRPPSQLLGPANRPKPPLSIAASPSTHTHGPASRPRLPLTPTRPASPAAAAAWPHTSVARRPRLHARPLHPLSLPLRPHAVSRTLRSRYHPRWLTSGPQCHPLPWSPPLFWQKQSAEAVGPRGHRLPDRVT